MLCVIVKFRLVYRSNLVIAPPVGFEPTTLKLTASCSAAELQGKIRF